MGFNISEFASKAKELLVKIELLAHEAEKTHAMIGKQQDQILDLLNMLSEVKERLARLETAQQLSKSSARIFDGERIEDNPGRIRRAIGSIEARLSSLEDVGKKQLPEISPPQNEVEP